MTEFGDFVGSVVLGLGVIILLIGSFGIIRLPDFFSRTHAASKCDTLGLALVLVGLGIQAGLSLNAVKLFLVAFFITLANPTAVHAIARAAFRLGLKPLLSEKKDSTNDPAH